MQNPFSDQAKISSKVHISKDDALPSQDPLLSRLVAHGPITLELGISRVQVGN